MTGEGTGELARGVKELYKERKGTAEVSVSEAYLKIEPWYFQIDTHFVL